MPECIIPPLSRRPSPSKPVRHQHLDPTMPANHTDLEKRLWDAADELRANSELKSSEYSVPVLGLIFLRYADHKFTEAEKKMPQSSGRRKIGKADYQAQGVLYLPEKSRFGYLPDTPQRSSRVGCGAVPGEPWRCHRRKGMAGSEAARAGSRAGKRTTAIHQPLPLPK